jgi:hypothetical protein
MGVTLMNKWPRILLNSFISMSTVQKSKHNWSCSREKNLLQKRLPVFSICRYVYKWRMWCLKCIRCKSVAPLSLTHSYQDGLTGSEAITYFNENPLHHFLGFVYILKVEVHAVIINKKVNKQPSKNANKTLRYK